jgi:uncharacterized iron-regulated membrane protein
MLVTGLYLWWPRDARGLGGSLYPRTRLGQRVFWRDLHAVTGIWVSMFALFLLVTAMPWTTVGGDAIQKVRRWVAPAPVDWAQGGDAPHASHHPPATGAGLATALTIDQVVARIEPLRLDPPVRLYLPNARQPHWLARSETQDRPRVREIELDPFTGAVTRETGFADKSALDRAINIGIAAHEGQLFGPANQLLGLMTALGLITLCASAVVMWLRRRPEGSLGIPAPRVAGFRITPALGIAIFALGVLLPMLGVALLLLVATTSVARWCAAPARPAGD